MKKIPYLLYSNIILMFAVLYQMYEEWDVIKADNSNLIIGVAATIPVLSLIACYYYIKQNKS